MHSWPLVPAGVKSLETILRLCQRFAIAGSFPPFNEITECLTYPTRPVHPRALGPEEPSHLAEEDSLLRPSLCRRTLGAVFALC